MEKSDLESQLKEIAFEIAPGLKNQEIDTSVPLVQQGMDSLDMVDYIFTVDSKFDIKIENEDYDQKELGTIDNMVAFLQEKMASSAS